MYNFSLHRSGCRRHLESSMALHRQTDSQTRSARVLFQFRRPCCVIGTDKIWQNIDINNWLAAVNLAI